MAKRKTTGSLPVLSPDTLDKVHRITEKCRAKLRTHENHWNSSVDRDKALEITSTYVVEEFNVRLNDYMLHYNPAREMLPRIIDATVKSIIAAFPGGTYPDSNLRAELKAVLNDYVHRESHANPSLRGDESQSKTPGSPPLSEQIRVLSNESRLTQEELAEGLEISVRSVARHLSGESSPSKRHIRGYEDLFSAKLSKTIRLKTS